MIQTYIDSYINWLKEKISFREINDWYEINTPFVNRLNDYIQIYAKIDSNGNVLLTDDGETIRNLETSGLDLSTPKRKKELEVIINSFGVYLDNKELKVKANKNNFASKKHNFIQALISIDDLFVIAQSKVSSFFLEDVENFLKKNEVRYSKNIILQGKSSYTHKFDILIPESKKYPERLIKVLNTPKRNNMDSILFSFSDTSDVRDNEGIVIINDIEKQIPNEVSEALSQYNVFEFPWSMKEAYKEQLIQ